MKLSINQTFYTYCLGDIQKRAMLSTMNSFQNWLSASKKKHSATLYGWSNTAMNEARTIQFESSYVDRRGIWWCHSISKILDRWQSLPETSSKFFFLYCFELAMGRMCWITKPIISRSMQTVKLEVIIKWFPYMKRNWNKSNYFKISKELLR